MTPLQTDLAELLRVTRAAERDLFASLDPQERDRPAADGGWSPKDVQGHLAAWRGIEARRIVARMDGTPPDPADPPTDAETDAANAVLQRHRADWPWSAVDAEADASVVALLDAIGRGSHEVLCECDHAVAGIGVNGANHDLGHLSDIARQADANDRYGVFAREVEAILERGHLPPRDSGVMLYNIACHRALTGDLDDARRLLRLAFTRRADLVDAARDDPDLVDLRDDVARLAPGKS